MKKTDEFERSGKEVKESFGEKIAPYTDYAGNKIKEGSKIRHFSGETGVVIFLESEKSVPDQWRVEYNKGAQCRLCQQVGQKGQAVVV